MNKSPDVLDSLYQFLNKNYPNNLLIPCSSKKRPIFKHKNNVWTWNDVVKNQNDFGTDNHQAILLKDFIVIDIDKKSVARKFEILFPVLTKCPLVETTKGFHYYFKRTPICDLYALYDHSRCFGVGEDEVDFKTICSTGTAGVVIIPPSKGKKWIRSIWNTPLLDFEGDILNYFYDNWSSRKYQNIIKDEKTNKNKIITDNTIGYDSFDKININDDEINIINSYVECTDFERSVHWNSWKDMCWCLKNISARYSDGDDLFKEIWITFSKCCPEKFKLKESEELWNKTIPRKNGLDIGSLKFWAKNDNPDKYITISSGDNIIDFTICNFIKDFVLKFFHYPPTRVCSIKPKDNIIYININELYCNSCNITHDIQSIYISISNKMAVQKCRITNNITYSIDYDDFPQNIKDSLLKLFSENTSPQKAVQNFIEDCAKTDENIKNMDITEISEKFDHFIGCKFDVLQSNICPIHKIKHETPSNCIYVNLQLAAMAVACKKDTFKTYPDNGISVPQNIINNIIGNTINNTTINNYYSDSDKNKCLILQDYQQDNLPFFRNDNNKYTLLLESFPGKHNDIARFVNSIYKDEFRYVPDNWYIFENHIWTKLNIPILRDRLSCDFCKIYKNVLGYYRNNENLSSSELKIKQIDSLVSNLKITHFKNSVMEECKEIYMVSNQEFNKTINCANIIPFMNGVLELDTLQFRDGRFNDNMIISTNIDFVKYNPNDPTMNEILNFINDILPDREVREYLLKICALCMCKDTQLQKLWILTGGGSNGKSIFIGLLQKTLGDFSKTINSEFLTSKSEKINESNDAIASLEYVRNILINEPAEKEIIQGKKIRMICGGRDKISVRGLFEKQKEYLPEFKAFLICNKIPLLSENTFASWRRIRLIDFPVKFIENPHPNNPLEKLIDEDLEKKIDNWAPYFAGYLTHWLKIIYDEGGFKNIKEPEAVMKRTQEYKDENDHWKEYIDEYLLKNENSFLLFSDLKKSFKIWLDNNRKSDKPKINEIKDYFSKHLCPWTHTKFHGEDVEGYKGWILKKNFIQYSQTLI